MNASRPPDVTPISLFRPEQQDSVDADLWDAITDKNLVDWHTEWTPALFERLKALKAEGVEFKHWPQSMHWNWQAKAQEIQGRLTNQAFSVVCDDMTQAMMITNLTHRARIEAQKDQHLVYIDFLEAAPWNRREIADATPRYAGCGTILILAAAQYSKIEGFKGRIGLHSLPQANDFYANTIGMTDLGRDADYQNLRYFEMTPEQAEAFIENRSKK